MTTENDTLTRYRGLRGIVRHLLPKAKVIRPEFLGRNPVGPADELRRNLGRLPARQCLWCGQEVELSRRTWHDTCPWGHEALNA